MSRVAKNPIPIPSGVNVNIAGQHLTIKGGKGTLEYQVHNLVSIVHEDGVLRTVAQNSSTMADALAGSTRALLSNFIKGVSEGFERKLELFGVGYRAQVQGKKLNLTLGFSHPVVYDIPPGITIETPSQTEIVIKGFDKQRVGRVVAEIRAYRPPEPYKGKGVRYAGERIELKETKKK
jgi:large subunit ribosomal protein L6